MAPGFVRTAVVLGLLAALGPVAIDMYLPALPVITADLQTTPAATQMSLTVYFVALSLFQLVYGPLSDMVGRKGPLFAGLGLFTVASAGCALAPNVETLIVMRAIQGIGGCACLVIPRAVVRDLYNGLQAVRLMALIMLVFSVGPLLAPFIGGLISELTHWRVIFLATVLLSLAALVLLHKGLPETRPPEKRLASNIRTAMASYKGLLSDWRFVGTSLIGGSGMAAFFSFLTASPFVYIDHYGLTPIQYAMAFSLNALGFFSFAQLNGRMGARIGLRRLVRYATTIFSIITVLLFTYFAAGGDSFVVLIGGLFCGFGTLGLVIPSATVLALDRFGHTAGTASSLLGTFQFGGGALAGIVVSLAGQGNVVAMTGVIAACSVSAFVMARLALGDPKPALAE